MIAKCRLLGLGLLLQFAFVQSNNILKLNIFCPQLFQSLMFGAYFAPEFLNLLLRAISHIFKVVLIVQSVHRMNLGAGIGDS